LSGVSPAESSTGCRRAATAATSHGIGGRAAPSLHLAGESRRNAATRYSGIRARSAAPATFRVLISGSRCSSRSSGASSPWNWSAPSRHSSAIAFTWPAGWSQNTPTGVTNGGSVSMMRAAVSAVTWRGVPGTKMKPRASTPASTHRRASSRLVMPHSLILIAATAPAPA